jgi:hypothetical protein
MDPQLEKEIERLRRSKVKELQVRYRELFGEDSPTSNRAHLFRRLAWRLQARGAGELSDRARQRAIELADDAELRRRAPRSFWRAVEGREGAGTHSGRNSSNLRRYHLECSTRAASTSAFSGMVRPSPASVLARPTVTMALYNMALEEFLAWFQQAPRPGFTKATVSAWRVSLEERKLGSSSIIVRMSAIRKLAAEAADNGLPAPELAAGIARVKSAKTVGILSRLAPASAIGRSLGWADGAEVGCTISSWQ